MLCVCMYETIDKTRVCRPLYVMGHGTFVWVWQVFIIGIIICISLGLLWCQVCSMGLLWLYRPQLRMVLPFGYWKFSIRIGVSHWFIWTHVHICTILGLANQSNSINVIEYPLSFIHYHLYSQYVAYYVSTNVDIYICTYEHIFICQPLAYNWLTYECLLMYASYALYLCLLVMINFGFGMGYFVHR